MLDVPHFVPKIHCFPFEKPNFRLLFFSIYGNFSFIVYELILSLIGTRFLAAYLFYSVFRFIYGY
jgi:hypothetical protein